MQLTIHGSWQYVLLLTVHVFNTPVNTVILNDDILPLLFEIGSPLNAGVKVKITDTGLAYMREIFMRMISEEVAVMKINKPFTRRIPNAVGMITVSNIRVIEYWKPEHYDLLLQPPHSFIWRMIGLGVRARGSFDTDVLIGLTPVKVSGEWDALIDYLDYEVAVTVGRDVNGYPSLSAGQCQTVVHGLDVQILNAGTLLSTALQLVKGIVAGEIKPLLATEVCEKTKDIINKKINLMLKTTPLKPRHRRAAGTSQKFNVSTNEVGEFVQKFRSKDLILDMTLMKAPTMIYSGAIITEHNGQITWQDRMPVPFFPPKIVEQPVIGRRMMQVYITDYVLNSYLYSAHRNGLLEVSVRADPVHNPSLASKLQSTCNSFCIGDLLFPVADEYPDHWIDIEAKTSKMPTILFLNETALTGVSGILKMFVRNKQTGASIEVIKCELSMTARLMFEFGQPRWDGLDRIIGALVIDRFELKLLNSTLHDVDQYLMDDLAEIAVELLDAMANQLLTEGFPIPKSTLVQLKKPRLQMSDHVVLLESYFRVDSALVNKLAKQVLGDLSGID